MTYHVEFSKRALKDIKKLDKAIAALILGWIRKNLEGCEKDSRAVLLISSEVSDNLDRTTLPAVCGYLQACLWGYGE